MAYTIGNKLVKDTTEYNEYAYGISLPIKRGNTGYFEQAYTSFDQAKSNLLNLLSTQIGERIMQPTFGTRLKSLLFEQMDDDFEQEIQNVIVESTNFWLPYITIKDIDVTLTDELKDKQQVILKIGFTVGSNTSLQELTFIIQG